jgi:hypothetical protein
MRNRALTLCIYDEQGLVKAAFQSYWYGRVTIFGTEFDWIQFEASGVFSGNVSSQGAINLELPATPMIWRLILDALASTGQWMAKVCLYEFDGGDSLPPDTMDLLGITRGQIVSATNDPISTLKVQLGSGISPVGANIPWRTATTKLTGAGIQA